MIDIAACTKAITDLRRAIDAAEWPIALACALDAWRAARAPALADLVDAIATRCDAPARPRALHDVARWWIDHAAYDPVTVTALAANASLDLRGSPPWPALRARYPVGHPVLGALVLADPGAFVTFSRSVPTHMNLVNRLAAMSAWPDDPRAGVVLCGWLVTAAVRWSAANTTRVLYELIAGELARIGDARALPELRACIAEPSGDAPELRELQVRLAAALVRELEVLPELPRELAVEVSACASAAPALRPSADPDGALWAQILAHPDDDAPRLVLADVLSERGDPRGQLIVMQCAGDPRTRRVERALIKEHWRDFVGDLAPLLARKGCLFRRGMLDVIAVGATGTRAGSYAGLRGYRELACVTTVRPVSINGHDYAVVLDAFDRLDVVDLALTGGLDALRAVRPRWEFRVVELRESSPPLYERNPEAVIWDLVALVPELRELHVVANLWTPPELRLAWLDELARTAPGVQVTLRAEGEFAARRRDGDDRLAPLRGRIGLVLDEAS